MEGCRSLVERGEEVREVGWREKLARWADGRSKSVCDEFCSLLHRTTAHRPCQQGSERQQTAGGEIRTWSAVWRGQMRYPGGRRDEVADSHQPSAVKQRRTSTARLPRLITRRGVMKSRKGFERRLVVVAGRPALWILSEGARARPSQPQSEGAPDAAKEEVKRKTRK